MRRLKRCPLWIACASSLLLAAGESAGGDVGVDLICPQEAPAGQNVTVDMSFGNRECTAQTVRVLSGIVGNASDTLAGVGVFGPMVAEPALVVPVGTDVQCGCVDGQCACSFPPQSCKVDAECPNCSMATKGTLDRSVDVLPTLPASLAGKAATVIVITEEEDDIGEVDSKIRECFVDVL